MVLIRHRICALVIFVSYIYAAVASKRRPIRREISRNHRSLSTCGPDPIPGWNDTTDGCDFYRGYCTGAYDWPIDFAPIASFTDAQNYTAFDACCECAKNTTLTNILKAPTDGSLTTVIVDGDVEDWVGIPIYEGQNVRLIGVGDDPPTISLKGDISRAHEMPGYNGSICAYEYEYESSCVQFVPFPTNVYYFFHVNANATFSAENIEFDGLASHSLSCMRVEGTVTSFRGCVFKNCANPKVTSLYFHGIPILYGWSQWFMSQFDSGALTIYGSVHEIVDCIFESNRCEGSECEGGAITAHGQVGRIVNTIFRSNMAKNGGGAITNYGKIYNVENCSFIRNRAKSFGGALYSKTSSRIIIMKNTFFSHNAAFDPWDTWQTYGGALYLEGISEVIENCTFWNNTAGTHGSDVYAAAESETVLRDSVFRTPEHNGRPRVVGPILTCHSSTNLTLCPATRSICRDTKRTNSEYGVTCVENCDLGFFGIGPFSCTACSKGKYAAKISEYQSEACILCPEGRYNNLEAQQGLESCKTCDKGMHSTMGAPVCLRACQRGQEHVSGFHCKDCPPGKYSGDNSSAPCQSCEQGLVAPNVKTAYCVPCPGGTYPNSDATECMGCPAGSYCPQGISVPIRCGPSLVAPNVKNEYCVPCLGGTYPNSDATECMGCPAGSYCPHGISVPIKCNSNSSYCRENSSFPTVTPPGYYTNFKRTSIAKCEPGHYCINGFKKPCPSNTFGNSTGLVSDICDGTCDSAKNQRSDPGAAECSCLASFHRIISVSNDTECACLGGTYRDMTQALPVCAKCPPNQVRKGAASYARECKKCGFFKKADDDAVECIVDAATISIVVAACAAIAIALFLRTRKTLQKYKTRVRVLSLDLKTEKRQKETLQGKVQELVELSAPSKAQESIFEKYRKILSGDFPDVMPFRIILYPMENITLSKSLGRGGYGQVFLGVVKENRFGEIIEKYVALKQLHIKNDEATSKILDNFINEVKNLAQLGTHKNIVSFYGCAWAVHTFPSIVLEYVGGGELTSFIGSFKYAEGDPRGLENPTLLSIALGILNGIKHIHDKNMLHRDIKPQNILMGASVGGAPVPKIADFGESRELDEDVTMTYCGTKFYVAPEVFRGERYGQAADIFSAGMILNELDTLTSVYSEGERYAIANRQVPGSFRPTKRADAPMAITCIISECLAYVAHDPEAENEVDLSYGRPSIDDVIKMLQDSAQGKNDAGNDPVDAVFDVGNQLSPVLEASKEWQDSLTNTSTDRSQVE